MLNFFSAFIQDNDSQNGHDQSVQATWYEFHWPPKDVFSSHNDVTTEKPEIIENSENIKNDLKIIIDNFQRNLTVLETELQNEINILYSDSINKLAKDECKKNSAMQLSALAELTIDKLKDCRFKSFQPLKLMYNLQKGFIDDLENENSNKYCQLLKLEEDKESCSRILMKGQNDRINYFHNQLKKIEYFSSYLYKKVKDICFDETAFTSEINSIVTKCEDVTHLYYIS